MVARAAVPFGLVLMLATTLPAQTPTPTPTPAPTEAPAPTPTTGLQPNKPRNIDQEIAEMRRQMTEGKAFHSHVRVTIRLKNGNRLNGIVKDGFVVERLDGIRFVAAEANEAGAGIRLYYWNGKGNFVFLPFADMQDYRINARVSEAELALIERQDREREAAARLAQNQAAAAQAAAAAAQAAQQAQTGDPAAASATPAASTATTPAATPAQPAGEQQKSGVSSELQNLYGLLQQYPPDQGWNQARRDEIARRVTVVGAKPTAAEQRFVDNFADWQRACALFGTKPADGGQGNGGDSNGDGTNQNGEPTGGRTRRRQR